MNQLPRITANFAISADGKITDTSHRPSGWTSREDHQRMLSLRKGADALLVGRGTLQADQMSMTVPDQDWQPLRCVVTHSGAITGDEAIFHHAGGAIHVLCTSTTPLPSDLPMTVHRGSLTEFLQNLHAHHAVRHLHCEGGGELMSALFEVAPPDTLYLTWAPHHLFGGKNSPTINGAGIMPWKESLHYRLTENILSACGTEMFLTYEKDLAQ